MGFGFVNPLPGSYQDDNLNTALWTLKTVEEELKKAFPNKSITLDIFLAGIAKTQHPGRFEKISKSPVIIRDGAHNPGAARALRDALYSDRSLPKEKKIHLIMGVFKDKDYREILRIMLPGSVSLTAFDLPDSVRGLPKEELAKVAEEITANGSDGSAGINIRTAGSLKEALEETESAGPGDVYVVFGSLSLMQLFKEI